MDSDTKGYNGWANYETWCVHLWLTNEEGSYRYWREEAERHQAEAPNHANVTRGILSVGEAARYTLGEAIKESFETFHPFRGEHLAKPMEVGAYGDLLDSALCEVQWYDVAEAFLEELGPDDEPGSDTEGEGEETDQDEENEREAIWLEDFERAKRERAESPAGPLFELGRVVSTPGALANLSREDIETALRRHHRGDWGDMGRSDWEENEASLKEGFRLFSVYHSQEDEKFWVITEADRSSTCVLLPSEY